MGNITFQYPSWYLILCVLLGLLIAGLLYYRDQRFQEQSSNLNWGLGLLRWITISLMSALLLTPLLKSLVTETKKPVVVLAQDESESVVVSMDSVQLKAYQQAVQTLESELSEQYDFKSYSFGEDFRPGIDFKFTDKVSNLSDMLSRVYDLYSNQNLGAVIVATDGIYNEGSNPIYASTQLNAPIYTIALGDTTPKRDLLIKHIYHNKIAYLGDKFSVQIDVSAQNLAGTTSKINVYQVGPNGPKKLKEFPININKNDFFTTQELVLEASEAGVQRFRISATPITSEVSKVNNTKDIFIDVLDARQNILILAHSPHPDITALKQTLNTNKNYKITTAYIASLKENIANFDFVILHQLPSSQYGASAVLSELKQRKIPHLFIIGSKSDLALFNQQQSLINIQGNTQNTNEVQATLASDFSLFNLEAQIGEEVTQFPPLLAPFGEFKPAKAQVLLYQRIGKVDTQYPLLLVGENNGYKTGVLCGEGIWKWRLFDYLQTKDHFIFNELIGKTVQYLALKEDKRKFRISQPKNLFNENEPIVFDAELYNESYELINTPDASLVITDSDDKNFNFTFNKTGNAYALNAGILPTGNYRYKGYVTNNGEQLTYDGQFSVQPIQLELYETTANHAILKILSEQHGGQVIDTKNVDDLATILAATGKVKPVIYQTSKTRSIINFRWLFALFAGLLTLEWFLRRYFGAY